LEAGLAMEEFLKNFPTVTREQSGVSFGLHKISTAETESDCRIIILDGHSNFTLQLL
jgi:hypothetical protein